GDLPPGGGASCETAGLGGAAGGIGRGAAGAPAAGGPPERDRGSPLRRPAPATPGGDDDPVPLDQLPQRHDDPRSRPRAAPWLSAATPASSRRASCSTHERSNSSTKRNGSSTSGALPIPARRRPRWASLIDAQPLSSVARSATQARSARSAAGLAVAAWSRSRTAGLKRRR